MARSVRSFRFPLIGVMLVLLLLSRQGVTAQDEQTELVSSANYVYGQSMSFNLIARNMGDIEKANLYFRLGTSPDSYAVEVPVTSGSDIDATYSLDLTQTRLPPFGAITYWWVLERPDGSSLRVPEQVVNYVDDQFNWQSLSETDPEGGGSIRFYWTGDQAGLGETARDITFDLLPELSNLIPLEMILPFDVYIYPSSADLSAALRLAGREYIPGRSYPDLGVVLITAVNPQTAESELRQGLARGLVDQLLYQSMGQYTSSVPAWLSAGLAGIIQSGPDTASETTLRLALENDEGLPITDLCAGLVINDDLSLAQSESIVSYIRQTYGDDAPKKLLASFVDGSECPAVFQEVLGTKPDDLAIAWRESWQQANDQPVFMSTIVWVTLVIAGFGLVALLVIRPRRRTRRKLK